MRPASNSGLLSPWWTLALPPITLGALILSPGERRMWVAPLATGAFLAMQWVLPRCRPRNGNYFGPINVAIFLMLIKLVMMPALIMLTGAENKVLSHLPSYASMQNMVLIDMTAYMAMCIGVSFGSDPSRQGGANASFKLLAGPNPGGWLVIAFAALGIVGFLAAFGSPGRIVAYLLDPSEFQNEFEGSFIGFAGTFLRPFLAFALVAWWANVADSPNSRGRFWRATLAGAVAAIGITIANLTFSFNRAAFVFPLVALMAAYSARVKRIPMAVTVGVVAIALPLLMAIGTLRSNRMMRAQTQATAAFGSVLKDFSETVQAYGGGPQFSALFCERTGWGEQLYGGSTLLASVMSPVPFLGKGFRETNGPALFNRAIYDVSDIEDQIIPFATELFVNFHLPGVVGGFLALGLLLAAAHQWFHDAESTFAAFSIQYVAMWAAMLTAWSASIFSQILIYFFGPIYFYVAIRHFFAWWWDFTGRRAGRYQTRVAA